jgi:hypothetical protein
MTLGLRVSREPEVESGFAVTACPVPRLPQWTYTAGEHAAILAPTLTPLGLPAFRFHW